MQSMQKPLSYVLLVIVISRVNVPSERKTEDANALEKRRLQNEKRRLRVCLYISN